MHSIDSGDCKFDIIVLCRDVSSCVLCTFYQVSCPIVGMAEFVDLWNMYVCNILIKMYCFQYKFMASYASDI
jgi:hypothetical protein